ncbi:MFS transporter [Janibacter endophyticus]|uniref:MFS transporter n=1 Tax=Janibacter endophyticus TaxID=2806261 RepID=UPI0027DC7A54|nr:MFS transporter [Janibacter endophyticus]
MPSVYRSPGMPALMLVTLVGFTGYAVLLPTAPLWAIRGGADLAGAGLVNGVVLLFTVLTQPVVPGLLRRVGWGPVLAVGVALMGLPSLAHLATDALTPTLVLSAVRGLGFGVLTVTGSAAVAELVDPRRRGAAVGAYGLAIAIPQVALLPVAPWLAEKVSFAVVFGLGALPLLGIPGALALGRHFHQRAASEPAATPSSTSAVVPAGRLSGIAPLIPPMLLLLGITLPGGAVLTFAPQLVDDPGLVVLLLVALNATAALARWRIGSFADIKGPGAFVPPLVVLGTLGMAGVALAVHWTAPVLLVVSGAVLGIAYGGLQNLTLLLSFAAVERGRYGTASAVWNIGFDLGTALGSVLIGAIAAGADFTVALLVAAGITLATLPLTLVGRRIAR